MSGEVHVWELGKRYSSSVNKESKTNKTAVCKSELWRIQPSEGTKISCQFECTL